MNYLTYTPEPHQEEAIEFATEHHYCIIGDDMGLGKTFEAIATLLRDESVEEFVVICPAHLKYNWKNELLKCQTLFREEDIFVCNDTFDLSAAIRMEGKVIILNYELLIRQTIAEQLFRKIKNWIVDEAHYAKNTEATRTMALHNYVEDYCPHRLILLTGTAIKNRVGEFYSLILLCSHNPKKTSGKSIVGMAFEHFRNKFMRSRYKKTKTGYTTNYKEWYGLRNKEKLLLLLDDKYIRRESTDIRGITARSQFIVMGDNIEDPALKAEWEAFEKGRAVNTPAKVKSANLMAPLTVKYVLGIIDEVEQVVVFSEHRKSSKIIADGLRKKGLKVGYIDGSVPVKKRQELVNSFQKGLIDVMVGTYLAMGTGFTMTSAWNCVTNDWPWVPGDLDQALKRIDRKTQTKFCINHHMVGGKVTKYIYSKLSAKSAVIKEIL